MGANKKKQRREANKMFKYITIIENGVQYPLTERKKERQILEHYAEPVLSFFSDAKTMYSVAIFSWNLSFFDIERREKMIEEYTRPFFENDEEKKNSLYKLITSMIHRKSALYPQAGFLFYPLDEEAEKE